MAATKTVKTPRKKATEQAEAVSPDRNYAGIREEVEAELHRNLNLWLPKCLDEKGGFHQTFDREWKRPKKEDARFVVFQARMTWLAATAMAIDPAHKANFAKYAHHGAKFLATKMWDADRGGFYDFVSRDGKPAFDETGEFKSIYGNSFAVYALASVYKATADLFALDLAFEAYEWIDAFAHDDDHRGYYNVLTLDGKRVPEGPDGTDETKRPGIKTMNTHIHLLEAFTELYRAAPHIVVREKLEELLEVVRDRIAHEPGRLVTILAEDWTPKSNEDSFGHDVETAYLLLDAADALGKPNDELTHKVARSLVDNPLNHGWREAQGSFAHAAEFGGPITDPRTNWWTSAEALNALLLMHELYGAETDKYWIAFTAQWRFIQEHHVDPEFGGWYENINVDGTPVATHKGGTWKEAYHETRSMMHVSDRLKRLAG